MFQCVYWYLKSVFLILFHCCILLEIKITTTVTIACFQRGGVPFPCECPKGWILNTNYLPRDWASHFQCAVGWQTMLRYLGRDAKLLNIRQVDCTLWAYWHRSIPPFADKILDMIFGVICMKILCFGCTKIPGEPLCLHLIYTPVDIYPNLWKNRTEWNIGIQYIPGNMHTVFALLCFVVVIHWLIFPYPSGLLHWHCGNLAIAPVPAKQPWWIWINTSCEFIMYDCMTTTKQSTTKPCAYFLGYTVSDNNQI